MKNDTKLNPVLYVDDEQENLDGFKYSFRKDYLIYTANTVDKALKIIRKNKIKVVLADQRMPDMNGTEFFRNLSDDYPDIVRIIITAFADVEVILNAINKGQVYKFIPKPWNKYELKVSIDNAIESYDLKGQNLQLITSLQKANHELNSINKKLVKEIEERKKAEKQLAKHRDNLELLVKERTGEIRKINNELTTTNQELISTNEELNTANEELEIINIALEKEINIRKNIQKNLEVSEGKFRNFIEQSSEGIILLNLQGEIIEWNKKMEEIVGLSKEKVLKTCIVDFEFMIIPEKKRTKKKYSEILASLKNYIENIDKEYVVAFEDYCQTIKGELKYLYAITFPVITPDRKYIGKIIRDLTAQKQAGDELKHYENHLEELVKERTDQVRENEQKLLNVFNSSSDAIIISDFNRKFLDVNETFEKITGYKKNELNKLKSIDIFLPEYTAILNERLEKLIEGMVLPSIEIEMQTKEGITLPVELNSKIIKHGGNPALLTIIRVITERKQMEKRMLETIIHTEEKEREKFAGNLHDEVGPLLSSLKMYISLLVETEDKNKKAYIIPQVQTLIKESITAVREISNDLSPHVLNTYGCIKAIDSFISLKQNLLNIDFAQNVENKRYQPNIEVIVYRIAKELINNTIKHANSSKIEMMLFEENAKLIFKYADDGVGFNYEEIMSEKKASIGLLNIVSRIKTVNGKYKIQTSPGKGFSFEMSIPVQE